MLTVIGLVVAGLSAVLSGLAILDARRSRQAAERSLGIAQEQHAVFLAQQAATTDFEVELSPAHPPDRIVPMQATSGHVTVRVRYRITNIGTRAAEPLRLNMLYPATCLHERWVTEDGTPIADASSISSDEELLAEGRAVATKLSYQEWERLSPNVPLIGFFQMVVPLPEGWSRIEVPFSIRAWSQPMPEGVANRRADFTFTLLLST